MVTGEKNPARIQGWLSNTCPDVKWSVLRDGSDEPCPAALCDSSVLEFLWLVPHDERKHRGQADRADPIAMTQPMFIQDFLFLHTAVTDSSETVGSLRDIMVHN